MALWGKAPATGRQGLDFRNHRDEPKGYFADVPKEIARNLALLTLLAGLGISYLNTETSTRTQALAAPSQVSTAPVTLASAN
ncbi:hypothetical protein BXY66_4066 [Shimia isoporae]|uniref:Uncharacterized protein n=1 Tax=Shimia isoporae TaxID=647720 RepID=A0A4V6NFJ2_9RHOB|nr:hypothetical protein [Shimia isoporae]TCK99001.1 hypothetical protein BXY66_4066 [Shimia isoporae]